MKTTKDYHLQDPTWCSGCGLYAIFSALKKTAASLDIDPEQMLIVTGIGCHGRLNNYFQAYGFHALHGRSLPLATGIKLSQTKMSVIVVSGDGDAYSIGFNHFIHSVRRNVDVTNIVVNNMIYALTQGQTSPTNEKGFVSPSTPFGSKELPLSGPKMALAARGSFIARGFSGAPKQLARLMEQGITHSGFSLIEVLSPCVTHNKVNTYDWYKRNTVDFDQKSGYDFQSKDQAWQALGGGKFALGLLYREDRPCFEDSVLPGKRALIHSSLDTERKQWDEILKHLE